jgi:hypothetical protein
MTSPLPQGANSDRWRKIEEVCDDALRLAPAERALYLAGACGDDVVLRGEVDKLLAHEESGERFLAQPIDAVAARLLADAPEPDLVGVRLGDYEIVAKLGAGGMGVVYRAKDRRLGRDVAIKVLPTALELDEARLARFEREARLLATVNHPHIGAIYGLVEADGLRALVLELVEGETLATALGRGTLRVERSLALAVQIAGALAHAHQRGVVHRDLKPSNIMLTAGGVKLLDFGVGKWSPKDGDSPLPAFTTLTADGAIIGTIHYMSPEQLEGRTADGRSDLFSFGAVLFEMLAGRTAFDGRSQAGIIAAILEGPTPRLPDIGGVPLPRLERVVAKCLAKDPDQRWQSARDLGDELQWIAEEIASARMPDRGAARGWLGMVLPVALACLVTGAVTFEVMSPEVSRANPELPASSIRRFTVHSPAGTVMNSTFPFALSPDGRYLVYNARAGDGSHLYLRALDQLDARVLPGTDGAGVPTFSPDGQWVAFMSGDTLKKVSAFSNAPPITLGDVTNCCAGGNLTWLPDDRIVLGRMGGGVIGVSASGGIPVVLSEPDTARGEIDLHSPQPLPGRRSLLLSVHRGADAFDIAVLDLDTGKRRAARLMRRVLVDHARSRGYQKRGGGLQKITFKDYVAEGAAFDVDLIALDRALTGLAEVDARKCSVIEMRFFGGLSVQETATALRVSTDTVKRDWRIAKLWLLKAIKDGPQPS